MGKRPARSVLSEALADLMSGGGMDPFSCFLSHSMSPFGCHPCVDLPLLVLSKAALHWR